MLVPIDSSDSAENKKKRGNLFDAHPTLLGSRIAFAEG